MAVIVVLLGASLMSPPNARATSYAIGDTGPGGGVVFITPDTPGNATGQYFEARLSGVDLRPCQVIPVFTSDVLATAIGDGSSNTTAIRDECAADPNNTEANSAFAWVMARTIGGYDDWFIPSTGEADRLWEERSTSTVNSLINRLNTNAWLSRVRDFGVNDLWINVFDPGNWNPSAISPLPGVSTNFLIARSFFPDETPTVQDAQQSIKFTDFRYFLPDGRECTSISPQRVQVGTFVNLPGEDALCRTSEGSLVAGWTIPVPAGFTGAGSSSLPLSPGHPVRVIESQRFTVVPFEPMITVEYDANIAADDACTPANMAFASDDGRVGRSWVPRSDIAMARTWSQAPCVPEGYELVGWNTRGDGGGQPIGLSETLPDSWGSSTVNERRLFAVWRAT